ncbi:U-box domain-containing protein 35 [Sesamum alatum]|uniref:RING-type E3 ubiquitin transferase n=1 Tax=Sesamum alatum TaxID=300844 RepID=A0AAE2CRD9_9LAMI|nr:U-box domain-containing protein 35 [Sesamum alatum]
MSGCPQMLHSGHIDMGTLYKDTSPVGTLCYIDPEYQRTGLVSPKSDVYAFGMVVLQLLTAKPAIALARTVEMAVDDDRLDRVLDAEAGNWPAEETKELAILALRCTELCHRNRPDLRNQILPALEKLIIVVMNDPCVAADGYSYDRKAIEEWLKKNGSSPPPWTHGKNPTVERRSCQPLQGMRRKLEGAENQNESVEHEVA